MKWIRASKACHTKSMRILVVAVLGRRAREVLYAARRIATVAPSERIVVVLMIEGGSGSIFLLGWWGFINFIVVQYTVREEGHEKTRTVL